MLKQTSKEFRAFFLLQFTKELIRKSRGEIFELENILKKEDNEKKERIKQQAIKVEEKPLIKEQTSDLIMPLPRPLVSPRPIRKIALKTLRIPQPKIPLRLQYLKPTPSDKQIDLGKLNPPLKDPMVRIIECHGPNKNIIVQGTMGIKLTNITLNKEEIYQVIEKFSETSKIPVQEGVFRVAVGRLILSAIVSKLVGSKFIIRKMVYIPVPRPIG